MTFRILIIFFILRRLWAVTSHTFDKKINGWVAGTVFYGSRILSDEKYFFPSFSEFELMILHFLAKKSRRSWKHLSTCPEEHLGKILFLRKKFIAFGFFSRDISDFWRDSLSWILNLPSTFPEEPLRGTKIGEKKIFQIVFGTLERLCRNFGRKIAAELSKLHSTYPEYEFQEKFFPLKT